MVSQNLMLLEVMEWDAGKISNTCNKMTIKMGSPRAPDNQDPGPVFFAQTKLLKRGISSVTECAGSMPRPTTTPSQ